MAQTLHTAFPRLVTRQPGAASGSVAYSIGRYPVTSTQASPFAGLGLAEALLRAVDEIGYETPTPIQSEAIPPLLAGRDLLGQAQTGTGKTAAFALPLLSRLDLSRREPQVLVLTPTRELAIQVAEAMQTYARHLPGFHVLPIYGGQSMVLQLRPLARGVHVVVGTPGRVLDHLRRGTLRLAGIASVVLDEADEMLRMGFIDDVVSILDQAPPTRQVALFSATMPSAISRIARSHLREPAEIRIASKTATVAAVNQRYWQVTGVHKLDALTRMLEVEDFDGMLVFVRTRVQTVELAERLEARGYASAAINGEMPQAQRERTVDRFKKGFVDILVATDVAARGLDVERVSHVLNYDIPYDPEAYVHRIGRTGRAGRGGEAILFVAPRERRMLRAIEHTIGQSITAMRLPTSEDVSDRRTERFKQLVTETLEGEDLGFFEEVVASFQAEHNVALNEIAAALAFLAQRERPLRMHGGASAGPVGEASGADRQRPDDAPRKRPVKRATDKRATRAATAPEKTLPAAPGVASGDPSPAEMAPPAKDAVAVVDAPVPASPPTTAMVTGAASPAASRPARQKRPPPIMRPALIGDAETDVETPVATPDEATPARKTREPGTHRKGERNPESRERTRRAGTHPSTEHMVRYRIEVGAEHGAEARNIVGAIANEAGLDSQFIGRVHIHQDHSIVELPDGMPKPIFNHLKTVWVCGQQLRVRRDESPTAEEPAASPVPAAAVPSDDPSDSPGSVPESDHPGDGPAAASAVAGHDGKPLSETSAGMPAKPGRNGPAGAKPRTTRPFGREGGAPPAAGAIPNRSHRPNTADGGSGTRGYERGTQPARGGAPVARERGSAGDPVSTRQEWTTTARDGQPITQRVPGSRGKPASRRRDANTGGGQPFAPRGGPRHKPAYKRRDTASGGGQPSARRDASSGTVAGRPTGPRDAGPGGKPAYKRRDSASAGGQPFARRDSGSPDKPDMARRDASSGAGQRPDSGPRGTSPGAKPAYQRRDSESGRGSGRSAAPRGTGPGAKPAFKKRDGAAGKTGGKAAGPRKTGERGKSTFKRPDGPRPGGTGRGPGKPRAKKK